MSLNLKSNTILKGDALSLLHKIPDSSIDLVVTDPPFFIMTKANIKFKNRADIIQKANFDNFSSYEDFLEFTTKWVGIIEKKMKKDSSCYIFFGAQYISDLLKICTAVGMQYKGIIIWHKTNPAPKIRKSGYLSSTELILFMVKGAPTFNFLGQKAMHNMIETPICQRPERLVDKTVLKKKKHPTLHPTQKPLKVIEKLVRVSSNENGVILDPFAGTGTVNLVCKKLQRYCISFEKNEKYYNAAVARLQKAAFD